MKFTFELDRDVPETVRISTEWRATFRLTRYSASLSEARICVRSPTGNSQSARFECLVWVKLASEHKIIVQESSGSPAEAAHLAIDRAASAVGRYLRHTIRHQMQSQGSEAGSLPTE